VVVEGALVTESPMQEKPNVFQDQEQSRLVQESVSTMKMMEELMEELISFQERFGPGAKTKERDRRAANS